MPVQAQRFEFLDKETNVSVTDFTEANNDSVLNSLSNELTNIKAEIAEFISNKNNKEKPLTQEEKDREFIDGATRVTKGTSLDLIDLSKLEPSAIRDRLKRLTGNNTVVSSILDNLPLDCKNKALGKNKGLKGPKSIIDCNGNKRSGDNSCGTKEFGDSINKLTNGAFNFNFKDPFAILDRLVSLVGMGFKLNLCGVFNALSPGIDTNILTQASALLLKDVAYNNDMHGVLDLANSSLNLNTKSLLPDTSRIVLENYLTPKYVKERELSSFNTRIEGALDVFDSNWKISNIDNSLNTHGVSNSSLKNLYKAKAMNTVISSTDLDTAPNSDELYLYTAFS